VCPDIILNICTLDIKWWFRKRNLRTDSCVQYKQLVTAGIIVISLNLNLEPAIRVDVSCALLCLVLCLALVVSSSCLCLCVSLFSNDVRRGA